MEAIDESRLFLADGRAIREVEAAPATDTRGKPRLGHPRVISGIIDVIKSGVLVDAPAAYGPRKTLYNRFQRWAPKVCGATSFMLSPMRMDHRPSFSSILRPCVRILARQGERNHAIGRSRGGRTTKIHALTWNLSPRGGGSPIPGEPGRQRSAVIGAGSVTSASGAQRRDRRPTMAALPAGKTSPRPKRSACATWPSTRAAASRSKTWSRAVGSIASSGTSAPASRPASPA